MAEFLEFRRLCLMGLPIWHGWRRLVGADRLRRRERLPLKNAVPGRCRALGALKPPTAYPIALGLCAHPRRSPDAPRADRNRVAISADCGRIIPDLAATLEGTAK